MVVLARSSRFPRHRRWVRVLAEEVEVVDDQISREELAAKSRRSGFNILGSLSLFGVLAMFCGGCLLSPMITEDWVMPIMWTIAFIMLIIAIWAFSKASL